MVPTNIKREALSAGFQVPQGKIEPNSFHDNDAEMPQHKQEAERAGMGEEDADHRKEFPALEEDAPPGVSFGEAEVMEASEPVDVKIEMNFKEMQTQEELPAQVMAPKLLRLQFSLMRAQRQWPMVHSLYRNQHGCISGGKTFDIQRGVRQGDVISPLLFNAALEHALRKWKRKPARHGFQLGGTERVTNIRYADDIMLHAKSVEKLVDMLVLLYPEFASLGLELNVTKTKILTNANLETQCFAEVAGKFT